MDADDRATLVALTDIDGIGDKRALELYRTFESAEELWNSPPEAFEVFHYVDGETYTQLAKLEEKVEQYRERFDRYRDEGIEVIGIDDERYPAPLRQYHAPPVLYAKGDLDRLEEQSVSVSGSRETNQLGQDWIREIARELADKGYTIISGGAIGTDTAAHEGALDATGATIVVLGTGVDTPFPEENAGLFTDIVDAGGLLLSHRPPGAGPRRHAFLDRNKTISALSPGTIIVATDGSGGTMAQYECAIEQDRQVFVPPIGQQIKPDGGLEELRHGESTTVVESVDELQTELAQAPSLSDGRPSDLDASEGAGSQTGLDEWG